MVRSVADLYRRAREAGDVGLLGVAESAMMEAMVAEAAIARISVAESLVAEALTPR